MKRYQVGPESALELLSLEEMRWLQNEASGRDHELLRRCVLAVLNSGASGDDAQAILESFENFDVEVTLQGRGLRFELINPPDEAFVDGNMIRGIREHLTSVVRDLVFGRRLTDVAVGELAPQGSQITSLVFRLLRNAGVFKPGRKPHMVVCWGGHAIGDREYHYAKEVGYELGLRGLNICTGCGPGAMKAPMKGATIAHAKQRQKEALYLGISEPGIIAAEAPNPIVSKLVIMPDIEMRLEAFVRLAHGIVIFPGGVGTAEELLYLVGILSHPENQDIPFPLVLSGPAQSADYFQQLDGFIRATLGDASASKYQIIIDDPRAVAQRLREGVSWQAEYRLSRHEAFHYDWELTIEPPWQQPFVPTHAAMAALKISRSLPVHELAINLRRLFSGIVAGNVKQQGLCAVKAHGPFIIHAETELIKPLDDLLNAFFQQGRMVLPGRIYSPCYRVQ